MLAAGTVFLEGLSVPAGVPVHVVYDGHFILVEDLFWWRRMSLILGVWREKLWIDSSGSSGLVNRGDPSSYVWDRGRLDETRREP